MSSELYDLTGASDVSASDVIYIVRSNGTVDRKITIADLLASTPFLDLATQQALDDHIADTTAVHGIADTASLGGTLKDRAQVSSGNKALTSTSWANLDTNLDLTVDADDGDWCLLDISFLSSGTPGIVVDAGTLVSGSITNMVSKNGGAEGASDFGYAAWRGGGGANYLSGGTALYQVVSGDIVSGQVTFRWRYRLTIAGTRNVNATADCLLVAHCVNLRA